MKPSPLKFALRAMGFISLVNAYLVIGCALTVATRVGIARAVLEDNPRGRKR